MKAAQKPSLGALKVFDDCLSAMEASAARTRSQSFRTEVTAKQGEYDQLAKLERLHTLPLVKYAHTQVVAKDATKNDLVNLYQQQMVPARKPARTHYDTLLIAEARCPYCDLGHSSTLDHFLPKSRFPEYAITPENLIPCCRDCQFKKGRHVAKTHKTQTLHPYYDNGVFVSERWVLAEVVRSVPTTARFRAAPPLHWGLTNRSRAISHFNAHGLAHRFAIESVTELTYLAHLYADARKAGDYAMIAAGLSASAGAHQRININGWKSALYQALSTDAWYLNAPKV